ncbi:Sds3-like-domain-containing protein [Pholiota molesta]|nr:Sds3-like-domain-containing protein [Pholiota molesta]
MDVDDEANDRSVEDPDVDMDPSEHDHDDDEDEDDGETHEEEDEEPEDPEEADPADADEEAVEADRDAEEEANDDDGADPEGDGDEEQDQDQEHDQDMAEIQQENEDAEDADNDDEHASQGGDADVDVEDHEESDLQPAHRAEALDVLATIELKFALLRERVYVEKMETLAWEEMLVQNAAHPELQHLQKELSKRRDKRLELASRKRSYEVANAVARRNADESNIWSWWMFSRDDLQTEMIAETSRKRRKLERERRAVERPQPIRRIPHPLDIMHPPLQTPSLRKIIQSYPFGSRKHNKPDTHHHRHSHSRYPKNLVYPEISTLSAADIQSDLDFLFQYRRDQQHQQQFPQPPHYPPQLQRNGSAMSASGMTRSSMVPNGVPPSMQGPQPSMGPPPPGSIMHPHPQLHGMGYEPYNDIPPSFGPGAAPGRVRDQYAPPGPGGPLPGGPPLGSSRDGMNTYANFPGPGSRLPLPPHGPAMSMGPGAHHGYPSEHEMSSMAPGGASGGGGGHQLLPNHPYFGQGSMGPGPPPSSNHMSSHHAGGMKGGMGMNGRRSVSPVHVMPNGNASAKTNGGSWMGMGGFHAGSGGGKGEWDARMMHEDEERERALREREQRERKRDEREKEKELQQRDREMARREREYNEQERERQREHSHMQQMSHRQASVHGASAAHSSLPHMHTGSAGGAPPPQGPGANPHHLHNHHHHRLHHHHVVHHHHPQQGSQHVPSSMPLPGAAPPIIHSPRSTREYEGNRPPPQDNKRQPSGHWPGKITDEPPPPHHSSIVDYRDRDRDAMNRERNERDSRKMHSGRHSTGPAMPPLEDRGDRPMAMPFVMASSHTMQQAAAGIPSSSHINGSGLSSSTSSPRGAPSWNASGGMDDSYRMSSSAPPPSGYPHDAHVRSPVQGHRYATSSGPHAPPPLGRMGNTSSSGIHHRMATPPLPQPGRARPPQSPSYPASASTAHRSPVTSPKMRALSPVPASSSSKHILSGPLPGPGYSSSPHLAGPGRTSTPTGHHPPPPLSAGPPPSMQDVVMKNGALPPYNGSSRTASPLMSSLQGSGRPTMNGGNGSSDRDRMDRDRERPSPRLGASVPLPPAPSKFSAAQMVDGH